VCGKIAGARHHIIALGKGGDNRKRNIVSLCNECHAEIHPWLSC
jgi:5-methylcytosine-specific restriction endonuclease McrA